MMEERDDEEDEDDDDVESIEDLKTKEEIDKEEKKEKERKIKLIKKTFRRKGDVLDLHYPEIYLNDAQVFRESSYQYCTVSVTIKPSQRNLICFVQQYLGFQDRMKFVRYVLLNFCRTQMKLVQAKREADLKFTEDFKKLRRKELIIKNKVKEKIEEIRKMAPSQDGGGDPFTAEDLIE